MRSIIVLIILAFGGSAQASEASTIFTTIPSSSNRELLRISSGELLLKIEGFDGIRCEPGKVLTIRILRDYARIETTCEPIPAGK